MPGIDPSSERQPIVVKFNKQNGKVRASWISESDFGTDDEIALRDGKRISRFKKYKQTCSRQNKKRIAALVVIPIFLLIVFGLVYLYYADASETSMVNPTPNPSSITVESECGVIEGVTERTSNNEDAYVFKGIPYSVPPIGDLRWKPPKDLKAYNSCWDGILTAKEFNNQCSQINPNTKELIGKEDCLYLNVWTPSVSKDANLPVLVYFHGGGLTHYSGSYPGQIPSVDMVTNMGVVTVTFNYRLNVFGFLALDCLTTHDADNSYGNYGFMDQILVLNWIKKNIVNFGGNPNSVTLMGWEAGALSTFVMLQSPLTRNNDLFHKIIVTGGPSPVKTSYKDAFEDNKSILNNTKCAYNTINNTSVCLRNLTTAELLYSIPWYNTKKPWISKHRFGFPIKDEIKSSLAVLDPIVLPQFEFNFKPDQKISIMIGSNTEEVDINPYITLKSNSNSSLFDYVNNTLSIFSVNLAQEAISLYYEKPLSNQEIYEKMVTDIRLTCPVNFIANELVASDMFVLYRYYMRSKPDRPIYQEWYNKTSFYVYSGWDINIFFGYTKDVKKAKHSQEEMILSNDIQEQIKHFIYYGHPLKSEWLPYPLRNAEYTNPSLEISTKYTDRLLKKCHLWNKYNLIKYQWTY